MARIEELEAFIKQMNLRHQSELRQKDEDIRKLKEALSRSEYAFRGICGEKLSTRVVLSEGVRLTRDESEWMLLSLRRGAEQIAHEAEERLGGRYDLLRELDAAARHIRRLEAQAGARGEAVTPYHQREVR